MIESIEIKNFRCFKETKIAKFGLVNLFGGMNNAGKTALLEAVYLAVSPIPSSIMFLRNTVRKEDLFFARERPQNAWDNLFYQQDNKQEISFVNGSYKVVLKCNEELDDLIDFLAEEDDELNQLHSALSEKEAIKSALHFDVYRNSTKECSTILVASKSGIVGRGSPSSFEIDGARFIPSSVRLSGTDLATEYDKARFDDKEEDLLKAFQLIDKNIEKVEIFTIGKPTLYLQRKNEKRMPITLFGDAITKVADFVLRIINNPNSIILIDEIENGIHYTAQAELWEMLFKLAIAYETQIFATTHSSEMIKAFAKVAQEFSDKAAYFEMARSPKTNLIKAIRHDVETLRFELDRNVAIRGE